MPQFLLKLSLRELLNYLLYLLAPQICPPLFLRVYNFQLQGHVLFRNKHVIIKGQLCAESGSKLLSRERLLLRIILELVPFRNLLLDSSHSDSIEPGRLSAHCGHPLR